MKIKNVHRAAFFHLRIVVASLLCLTALVLGLFAIVAVAQQSTNNSANNSPRWLTRLASSVGIKAPAQSTANGRCQSCAHEAERAGGGAAALSIIPEERSQMAQPPLEVPYSGPPVDLRPVVAVRSGPLRDIPPLNPLLPPAHVHPEPLRPPLPTRSAGSNGPSQTIAGPLASAPSPTGLSFDGVGVGLAGFAPSSNPPDVNGRVGSSQYVQWNNTSFAVFNKTTGALQYGPAAGNTLFQALGGVCASHNDGDPVVSYDILAGRWVISQFVVAASQTSYSHQCFAISTTSDATGEYYLYDFLTDPVNFVDYPHTGVWPDGYYMSAHVFGAGLVFISGRIYVFERSKMIAGLPARMQSQDLGLEFGFLPADLDSLTPPPVGEAEFLLGPNDALTNLTDSFRVAVTWDPAPSMVVTPGPPIPAGIGNAPCISGAAEEGRDCVPEPPPAIPTDYLDNISGHYMYRLAYRNNGTQALPQESLVVSGPSEGSDANHGAVEWFEFRNAGSSSTQPTLFQSGTYDIDTSYRWLPSIAMDRNGNMALGYSKSSTTVKPGIYLTGRLVTDTPGTMGAEVEMQAGLGVQLAAANRWGDYSAMTLDPIDQCTFYYTNEYLKTDGGFNWSTRIAAFKFPSCTSAAGLWGTVTGTITSSENGAPISGVTVTLSNGYAGASNAAGVYTILVPAGAYTATAADPNRNCTAASPPSASVAPTGGGPAVTQNFAMTGASKLEADGFTIDDSTGNSNGIINRSECVKLNLGVKNNGCAKETAISATLTTTTPGVTVTDANSGYPDMLIDGGGTNTTPFKISLADTFGCGTDVGLSLNLTYASGTKTISYTIPTCSGGPNQTIPPYTLTTSDTTQADRLGRDGRPSTCGGKVSPGGGFAGTHWYKTWTFNNNSAAPHCYTVTINAALGGPGDIESVAYDQVYDPTNLDTNYLGDSGVSGLGTTLDHATYSFTVPAGHDFVIVVATTGSTTSGMTASSQFSGTVAGFINPAAGPGACSGGTTPTPTATMTATPPPPTPTPTGTATATPSATSTVSATASPTATASVTATATPAPTAAQLQNISTRLLVQTGDNVGIGGFIIAGSVPKHVLVRGIGPSLSRFGVPNPLPDPVLELHGAGSFVTLTNDNWKDTQQPEIEATGLAPTDDKESAIDVTLPPGSYTAIVRGKNNAIGVGLVEVYDLTQAAGKLGNISTRAFVSTGGDIVIAGFIMGSNSGDDRVVLRGLGPSLSGFGLSPLLANPTLELRDSNGALLKSNNDWQDDPAQAAEINAAGLAPRNQLEAAIAATLSPGQYTALLIGLNNGTGIGIVEVYDRGGAP